MYNHVVFDPNVVCTTFGHRVLGDFARMIDVADVQHVADAAHGKAFVRGDVKERWEDFVADEKIVAIAID